MMAHAVGIELDEITTTWEKWVTDTPITTAKGIDRPGRGGGHPLHHQRHLPGRAPHLPRARQPGRAPTPPPTGPAAPRTTSTGSRSTASPSITQETAFRFTDGSGRDAAAAGCLATGLRALNAVPAVNDLPAGVGHRRSTSRSSPASARSADGRPAGHDRRRSQERHDPRGPRRDRADQAAQVQVPAVPRPEAVGRDRRRASSPRPPPATAAALYEFEGRDAIMEFLRTSMGPTTMLTQPPLPPPRDRPRRDRDRATGVWALEDTVILTDVGLTSRVPPSTTTGT